MTEYLGRFPDVGDRFTWKNLTVTVEALDEMRVTQILVEVSPVSAEEAEAEKE